MYYSEIRKDIEKIIDSSDMILEHKKILKNYIKHLSDGCK